MTLVNAYDISRLTMIFFAFHASYINCIGIFISHPFLWAKNGTHKQVAKDNTSDEYPLSNLEVDHDTIVQSRLSTFGKYTVRPALSCQHGDSGV